MGPEPWNLVEFAPNCRNPLDTSEHSTDLAWVGDKA